MNRLCIQTRIEVNSPSTDRITPLNANVTIQITGPSSYVVFDVVQVGPSTLPTTTGCFSGSNPPTTWVSVQCVTAPSIPLGASAQRSTPTYSIGPVLSAATQIITVVIVLAFLGYMFTHRKK